MSAVHRLSRQSAAELRKLERRAKVVELASQAVPYRAIAEEVGCALNTVQRDLAEHWEETRPDAETTERLRALQSEEYDALRRRCYSMLAQAEDHQAELAIVDRIVRITEHRRRLHGLDVPVGVKLELSMGTREWLAQTLYGSDGEDVVDVPASDVKELTDGE